MKRLYALGARLTFSFFSAFLLDFAGLSAFFFGCFGLFLTTGAGAAIAVHVNHEFYARPAR